MAALDAAARKKLPAGDFGLASQRKFPMENAEHAANAKGRATQAAKKGELSASELSAIKSKADKILTRGKLKKAAKKKAPVTDTPPDPDAEGDIATEGSMDAPGATDESTDGM